MTQALVIQMDRSVGRPRLNWLLVCLIFNFGVLFVFKYFNFFSDSARALFGELGLSYAVPALGVLLPIGISFYTFQAVGYSIDVYRGTLRAERHPGIFAVFVAFFPQLVAGPIERAGNLLPQFRREHSFDAARISLGLKQMLWGLFQKVFIADRLAVYVGEIYGNPSAYDGPPVWIATYFFAFQIYCDFAGYSNIAIGAARVLGFELMENFRRPYFSTSVAQFWQRWHISLSTWFRDYLYFPLGGNRRGQRRTLFNIALVFALSGLWHGANWTFVVWGALHALYMMVPIVRGRNQNPPAPFLGWRSQFSRGLSVLGTFHLVCFAWIFFRAQSLGDAQVLIAHCWPFAGVSSQVFFPKFGVTPMVLTILGLGILFCVEWSERRENIHLRLMRRPRYQRWAFYQMLIALTLLLGAWGETEFVYFQF